MAPQERASKVKAIWARQLRQALRQRGFGKGSVDEYARTFTHGSDNVNIRLRAAGRGESAVDLLHLAIGITVHAAEQQAANLRGSEVNTHKITVVKDLFQLAAETTDGGQLSRTDFTVSSTNELPAATAEIMGMVDAIAEPWLSDTTTSRRS